MSMAIAFWVIMLVGLILSWPGTEPRPLGGWAIGWALLGLLGWKVFGAAIHG